MVHYTRTMYGRSTTLLTSNRGKFYEDDNKDREIDAQKLNNMVIGPKRHGNVSACGRENAWSGTSGTLDLYIATDRVCTLYWSCPQIGSNEFYGSNVNSSRYSVTLGVFSSDGPLGQVDVTVSKVILGSRSPK